MAPQTTQQRDSVLHSPWYWAYVFVTFALIVLFLNQDRILNRQTQIERKYQGRQRAARAVTGGEADTPMSTRSRTQIELGPIYATLIVAFIITGIGVIYKVAGSRRSAKVDPERQGTPAATAARDSVGSP